MKLNHSKIGIIFVCSLLFATGITYQNCGQMNGSVEDFFSQTPTEPTDKSTPNADIDDGYDVILVIGQSNTHSGLGLDPRLDGAHPQIFQLGRFAPNDYKVIAGGEPLEHATMSSVQIGFALSFAKQYVADKNNQRKVLIVPCGVSGTGFLANNWNPGDPEYEDALERTNFVLNKFKDSKLVAILWHQGENDSGHTGYDVSLDTMINTFRNGLVGNQQNVPFLLGGLATEFVDHFGTPAQLIQTFLEETPSRVPHTYFVSSAGLPLNDGDFIHFNAAGQRTFGKRYFQVFKMAD
jgi:hypothetical protein